MTNSEKQARNGLQDPIEEYSPTPISHPVNNQQHKMANYPKDSWNRR